MVSDDIEIRIARLDEIIDLRTDVLIRGTVRVSPRFDGDDSSATRHFGAFASQSNVACASCMLGLDNEQLAWQLRGMATADNRRRQGVGKRLIEFIEGELLRSGETDLMWCNARTEAVGFYEGVGWKSVGDEFDVAGVGPHVKMTKTAGV